MTYRDDRDSLMERLASLERQVQRTEQLEQRVRELEQENQQLRQQQQAPAASSPAPVVDTAGIYVDEKIRKYVDAILAASRGGLPQIADQVLSGVPPADAELVLAAARARAVGAGRKYLVPQDINVAAPGVLANRMILTEQAQKSGTTVEALIARILELVEVP